MLLGQAEVDGLAGMPPGPSPAAALAGLDLTAIPDDDIVDVLVARSRRLAHDQALLFEAMNEVLHRWPFAAPGEVRRGPGPGPYSADEVRAAPAFAISSRGISPSGALLAGAGSSVVFLIALPLWGALPDRIGRKPVMLTGAVLLGLLLFPLDAFNGDSPWRLFVPLAVAQVLIAAGAAGGPAVYAEIFPTRVRAAGVGVPYSIPVALFGGTAPYLQTYSAGSGTSPRSSGTRSRCSSSRSSPCCGCRRPGAGT